MLIKRIVLKALLMVARNPTVQRQAGEAAGKVIKQARPGLMKASHEAGKLTRKARDKVRSISDLDDRT